MAKTWCNLSSYSVNSHVHKQVEISPAQSLFLVRMVCILASCVYAIIRCFRELSMGERAHLQIIETEWMSDEDLKRLPNSRC